MSLLLNWVIGPAVMFALAWLLLPDLPEYRTGLIIVGLARCIAMVLIWNDLACGNRELAAVLVAINSLFQIAAYSLLGYFYLQLLPGWLGLDSNGIDVTVWEIAKSVLIFLGIPLARRIPHPHLSANGPRAPSGTKRTFLPRIGPIALYGLLFTIVILFALQGDRITNQPLDVARIALPLLAYFAIMWFGSFFTRAADAVPVRPQRLDRLHRRWQQLRTGDRRRDRRVRRFVRAGARRCRRPPHRSASPRRARLRLAVGATPLLLRQRPSERHPREHLMPTTKQRRSPAAMTSCADPDSPTPVVAPDDDTLALMAKALAHPARVRIIRVLDERTTCVTGDVVLELGLAQSTVSEHLRILREAGLVQGEIEGPRTRYCVNTAGLAALKAGIIAL